MTTTINASNSGSGGLIQTADASGVLALQTAGTTAVTIDTSQNMGIGTTTPSYRVDAVGAGAPANGIMRTSSNLTNSTTKYGYYTVGHYTNATVPFGFICGESNSTENNVHIGGGAGEVTAATRIDFNTAGNNTTTAGTERMRIDSSGNLLVGTTNTSATAGVGMKFIFSVDATNPVIKSVMTDSSGAYSTYNLYCTNASAYRFYVTTAGVVNATTTTITAISDQRLKENIRDLDDGLEKVLALKPRKFDWKENKGENIKNARGFIAQELELVFPDMISNWIDEPPEGEEPYKAVNANLIPSLVKAIQEQQALITSLTARIAALEGTPA